MCICITYIQFVDTYVCVCIMYVYVCVYIPIVDTYVCICIIYAYVCVYIQFVDFYVCICICMCIYPVGDTHICTYIPLLKSPHTGRWRFSVRFSVLKREVSTFRIWGISFEIWDFGFQVRVQVHGSRFGVKAVRFGISSFSLGLSNMYVYKCIYSVCMYAHTYIHTP